MQKQEFIFLERPVVHAIQENIIDDKVKYYHKIISKISKLIPKNVNYDTQYLFWFLRYRKKYHPSEIRNI